MAFDIKMNVKPPAATWAAAGARVRQAVYDVFKVFAVDTVRRIQPKIPIKTGELSRSVYGRPDWDGSDPVLLVGMGKGEGGRILKYAMQREFGGEIRARNVKYLTIPTGAMATPSGVESFTAAMARTMFKWTWVQAVSKSDPRLFIWGKNDPKGPRIALFRLKESVKQEGLHVFMPTVEYQIPRIRRGIRLACRNAVLGRETLAVRNEGE